MMIVLDCCAALALTQTTAQGDLVRSQVSAADVITAPELLKAELASAYRKLVLSGGCSMQDAVARIRSTIELVDLFVPLDELCIEAFSESIKLNHSSYDMFYFVLARRNAATLITLDKALGRLCHDEHVDCTGWE